MQGLLEQGEVTRLSRAITRGAGVEVRAQSRAVVEGCRGAERTGVALSRGVEAEKQLESLVDAGEFYRRHLSEDAADAPLVD